MTKTTKPQPEVEKAGFTAEASAAKPQSEEDSFHYEGREEHEVRILSFRTFATFASFVVGSNFVLSVRNLKDCYFGKLAQAARILNGTEYAEIFYFKLSPP